MKTKIKIELEKGRQEVEIIGNPLDILAEFTGLFMKHKQMVFLITSALKMAEQIEKDNDKKVKKEEENFTSYVFRNQSSAEGFAIIDNYMEHCKDFFDNKN